MRALAALALTLFAATANAQIVAPDSFRHKSGYVVDISHKGAWMTLHGKRAATGTSFEITVSPGGRVTGIWEGQPVNFILGAKTLPTELAAVIIK